MDLIILNKNMNVKSVKMNLNPYYIKNNKFFNFNVFITVIWNAFRNMNSIII